MTDRNKEWLAAYQCGKSVAEIADEYDVTRQAVHKVIRLLDSETRSLIEAKRMVEKAIVLRTNRE